MKKHFTFIYTRSKVFLQSNPIITQKQRTKYYAGDIYWTWKGIISYKENPITGINKSSDRSLRSAIFINIVLYRSPYFSLGYMLFLRRLVGLNRWGYRAAAGGIFHSFAKSLGKNFLRSVVNICRTYKIIYIRSLYFVACLFLWKKSVT